MKKSLLLLSGFLIWANAAVASVYLDQTTTISGTGNIMRAYRVPTTDTAGVVKYYDITLTFQQDTTGKPILPAANAVVALSPVLLVGQFKAGKYRDGYGNYYMVGGPSAATNGRTSWSVSLIKRCSKTNCYADTLSGSWTTGPIAGHPIEATLKAQGITSTGFSWGAVSAFSNYADTPIFRSNLINCSGAVGYAQSGNTLSINGYCDSDATQTGVLTLSLCTTANPCP